ncbi:MAG TPA: acyl carrier protein [Gammaproteobacteria bacterium]|nr:acyl carrier protein [Gammaproteobacteria bacterium]
MDRAQLKLQLKQLIVTECEKKIEPATIQDDAILIGSSGALDLDSLDALQIALAVKQRYGKRIDGNNQTRAALTSINTLADFILSGTAS